MAEDRTTTKIKASLGLAMKPVIVSAERFAQSILLIVTKSRVQRNRERRVGIGVRVLAGTGAAGGKDFSRFIERRRAQALALRALH
jgi:hypothetical protein